MKSSTTYHFAELPLTKLHYLRCETAKSKTSLIILPATITNIIRGNWQSLVEFFAQKFTVYLFDLPGHGESSPFLNGYDSKLTAETVGHLVDHLHIKTTSIMGFSFGGMLAYRTLIAQKKTR